MPIEPPLRTAPFGSTQRIRVSSPTPSFRRYQSESNPTQTPNLSLSGSALVEDLLLISINISARTALGFFH
ncbi:hypothetical protein L2E82_18048 [Cichorium intybus]|uniref:Uncharacterized protein n=1 Tax=Cichorium intybus TaxID=13427 RepID=A0ACB9FAK3_CICIN|nr:hypothetical protein L2E82_18048 [Cichorium intybus]